MPVATIAAFWGVSILFVLTPGADWAYAISSGLRHRSVVPAVGGLLSGHLLATLVVAAGVAALLAGSPTMLAVMTVAGAGYLIWLGVGMLRHPASVRAQPEEAAGSTWRQAIKGFAISGLNPKVFLLFLALLPQFVVATATWDNTTNLITFHINGGSADQTVIVTADSTFQRVLFNVSSTGTATWTFNNGGALVSRPGFPPGLLKVELSSSFGAGTAWPSFFFDFVNVTSP